jgi:hypothetical protein
MATNIRLPRTVPMNSSRPRQNRKARLYDTGPSSEGTPSSTWTVKVPESMLRGEVVSQSNNLPSVIRHLDAPNLNRPPSSEARCDFAITRPISLFSRGVPRGFSLTRELIDPKIVLIPLAELQ